MKWDTWKLLPQDTRIALRPEANFGSLLENSDLNLSRLQLYRYKNGISRLTIAQLNQLDFDWTKHIDSVGLATSTHRFRLPEQIRLTEALAWLIGFHSTESSETPMGFGVCNTELALIEAALQPLVQELNIPRGSIKLQIRWPENQDVNQLISKAIAATQLDFSAITTQKIESKYKPLFTLRVNSRLIRDAMRRLEKEFEQNALQYPKRIRGAYLRAVFDADGWFNTAKKVIVLAQVKREPVEFVCKLLKSLGISFWSGYWKQKRYYSCVVHYGRRGENLRKYMHCVGFSHQTKREKVNGSIADPCQS